MFIQDKYKLNDMKDILYNKDIYENFIIGYNMINKYYTNTDLNNLIDKKSKFLFNKKPSIYNKYLQLPNLLIYGNSGSGKNTFIDFLLNDIYDSNVNNIYSEIYSIKKYGNTVEEITLEQSKYHIIYEPKNTGIDKHIILEVLKEYSLKSTISLNYPFRIILIKNIHTLNNNAQNCLKNIIDNSYKTCKFIIYTNEITSVMEPLKSRFLDIKLKNPNKNDIKIYILKILINENKELSKNQFNILLKTKNIKIISWILQMYLYNIEDIELSWKKSINLLIDIMKELKLSKNIKIDNKIILNTRDILYNIFTTNIEINDVIIHIITCIIDSKLFDKNLLYKIFDIISETESRINNGKRSTIHLDYMLCSIYESIYNYYHN